VTMGSNV